MAIDQAKIGDVAAGLMDALEEHGYGEDAEITDVVLIAAVTHNVGRQRALHWRQSPGMSADALLGLLAYVQAVTSNRLGT
jgi:hypothetical protein